MPFISPGVYVYELNPPTPPIINLSQFKWDKENNFLEIYAKNINEKNEDVWLSISNFHKSFYVKSDTTGNIVEYAYTKTIDSPIDNSACWLLIHCDPVAITYAPGEMEFKQTATLDHLPHIIILPGEKPQI